MGTCLRQGKGGVTFLSSAGCQGPLHGLANGDEPSSDPFIYGPNRLVVRTWHRGRDNPGSTPGGDILLDPPSQASHTPLLSRP